MHAGGHGPPTRLLPHLPLIAKVFQQQQIPFQSGLTRYSNVFLACFVAGENQSVEFKQSIPKQSSDLTNKLPLSRFQRRTHFVGHLTTVGC